MERTVKSLFYSVYKFLWEISYLSLDYVLKLFFRLFHLDLQLLLLFFSPVNDISNQWKQLHNFYRKTT